MYFIGIASITLSAASFALAQGVTTTTTNTTAAGGGLDLSTNIGLLSGSSLANLQCEKAAELATCAEAPAQALATKCDLLTITQQLAAQGSTVDPNLAMQLLLPKLPCICAEAKPLIDTCFPICQAELAPAVAQFTQICALSAVANTTTTAPVSNTTTPTTTNTTTTTTAAAGATGVGKSGAETVSQNKFGVLALAAAVVSAFL
jgi:hypothetical protein